MAAQLSTSGSAYLIDLISQGLSIVGRISEKLALKYAP